MPFNIIWDVKEFSSVTEIGKSILCPSFVVEGERFKLEVFPKGQGESSKDYVSVLLHSLSKEPLKMSFSFFTMPSSFSSKENVSLFKDIEFNKSSGFVHGNINYAKTTTVTNGHFVLGCHIGFVEKVDSFLSIHEKTPIVSSLLKMYQDGKDTDVTLIVDDQNIKCHKLVLCARSEVFNTMLTSILETAESQTKTVVVQEFSYDSMKTFVERMYTCEVGFSEEDDVAELLQISDYYDVEDFKANCVQYLLKSGKTNEGNIFEVLKVAHKVENMDLMYLCVSVLVENPHLMKTEEYKTMLLQNTSLCFDINSLLGEICHQKVIVLEDIGEKQVSTPKTVKVPTVNFAPKRAGKALSRLSYRNK